jgi:hypothetical protein
VSPGCTRPPSYVCVATPMSVSKFTAVCVFYYCRTYYNCVGDAKKISSCRKDEKNAVKKMQSLKHLGLLACPASSSHHGITGGADKVDSVSSWLALGRRLRLPWALPVSTPAGGALTLKTKLFLALFAAYRTCRVTCGSGAAAAGAERGGGEQQGQGCLHVLSLRCTD